MKAYSNDSSMKRVDFESFQDVNGEVKVTHKMIFNASNTDPAAGLRSSMADGMLGQYAVDPASLDFAQVQCKWIFRVLKGYSGC
jgi:hypothetical protein